jgi:GT2 family glycosyltransferase
MGLAKGEYILSLDNDILVNDKNLLKKLLTAYTSKKNIGFLQVPLLDKGKNKTHYYGIYYSVYGLNMHRKEVNIKKIVNSKRDLIEIVGPTGGFFLVKKTAWRDVGGFDESQGFHIDDVDIGPRSMILGYRNYLYTKIYALHLGIHKTKTARAYANRLRLVFSGHARSMIKNYRFKNLMVCFPVFCFFQVSKAIKFSVRKKSPKIILAFLSSVFLFFINLPGTISQRKTVQLKRTINQDRFLFINPPKFNT